MNYRSNRVSNLIRDELSILLERELEFPNAIATITEVQVTKKLDEAKVRVSVLPSTEAAGVLVILSGARNRLQHLLMKKLNIKPLPHIYFEIDRGPENAAAVEKLLIDDNNK